MTTPTAAAQLHARGIPTRPAAPGFGETMRRYRLQAGMTQHQLAYATFSNHTLISRLESGERNPQRYTVERIVDALRLDARDAARLYAAAGYIPACLTAEDVMEAVEKSFKKPHPHAENEV